MKRQNDRKKTLETNEKIYRNLESSETAAPHPAPKKTLMWICANYPADIVIALSPDESNEVFCSDENKVAGGRGDVERERERGHFETIVHYPFPQSLFWRLV